MDLKMNKRQLSWCGGDCKENSVVTELYDPFRLTIVENSIFFNRVMYCINHGCGWRLKIPAISVPIHRILEGKSRGINSYLRRTQKRFPKFVVKKLWLEWVKNQTDEKFNAYLTRRMK